MTLDTFFILFACAIGLLMTFGVGANDLANIMSTTMGSKAVTAKQAFIIAIVFEFAGAFLGGTHVTNTIRTGVVNIAMVSPPTFLIYGMLAILLSGSVWISLASYLGMPVSITNAIVGALVGFGGIALGMHAVHWEIVRYIAISWISCPVIAGIVAFLLFITIRQSILSRSNPAKKVRLYVPVYLFLVGTVLSVMVILKGLAHVGILLNFYQASLVNIATSIIVMFFGLLIIKRIKIKNENDFHAQLKYVEKIFSVLMALTACAMVFAHGANDVSVAIGPVAAIIGVIQHGGELSRATPIPYWTILLGCVGVVIGFVMYGRKIIETVGSGITALTPSRAFAATLAAATTVLVSTSTGIPVSATQTLVGAVLGVGLAGGIGALNLSVIRNIFMSWVITLPAAAGLAVCFFYLIRAVFH
ncbi:MAG: inorganic phosphate transporter [Gammaproteobacteria bacterium]